MTTTTRDDAARVMIAAGDAECSKTALYSITGNTEKSRQLSFNRAAEIFVQLDGTTAEDKATVAKFVRRFE